MDTNTPQQVTNGLIDLPWLYWDLWGNLIWHYLVFLGYVIAAVFLSKLTDVLATPLTACLLVIAKQVPGLNFLAVLLSDEPTA